MDKRHFIQIINNNRGQIRSLCQLYYVDAEDQKDAFQDIVLQLWKSIESFRGDASPSTWIYRVSLNTILSHKRKNQKTPFTQPIESITEKVSSSFADDNLELLPIIIRSLKDMDKAIVILYLEGYQNKEIAELLKISPSNVGTRFNRIKSQLKLKFNQKTHAAKRI